MSDTDVICEAALVKIKAKYIQGMIEHGQEGLEGSTNDPLVWIKAIQEEAIDTVMYCEKIIHITENIG